MRIGKQFRIIYIMCNFQKGLNASNLELFCMKFGEKIEFFILNSIYHAKNKNCAFYQKMVKIKFVDLFETNNFVP